MTTSNNSREVISDEVIQFSVICNYELVPGFHYDARSCRNCVQFIQDNLGGDFSGVKTPPCNNDFKYDVTDGGIFNQHRKSGYYF